MGEEVIETTVSEDTENLVEETETNSEETLEEVEESAE